ncbi:hypothetical protein Cgig2_018719 [Carnegiea gigantea]|uniref:Uncharacterized protein n=1 Tax=Carnegiea gigantea TaxID=171969 RepID=A0A9Q1KGQ8_9CARY|nr:hypothetical protein Cgig2_018719 [Carnegiea gigantea]
MSTRKTREEKNKIDLLDLVFSWSFTDILNNNLFKDKIYTTLFLMRPSFLRDVFVGVKQVKKIPDNFSSVDDYLGSFNQPLIEETRASLCSGLEVVGEAPACEIWRLFPFKLKSKPPQNRFGYNILTRGITSFKNPGGDYEPECGDLVLLTNARVKGMHDLNITADQFVIASVLKQNDNIRLVTAEEISHELRPKGANRIYATYLINMTTNMRIWWALNHTPKTANFSLIKKVLQYDSAGDNDCTLCLSQEKSTVLNLIDSFKLDESQKKAVLNCSSIRQCPHQSSNVKLIWGPPGTGKTKTVASLLFVLLKLRCRTLTCAPTNIAVLQVAERLMGLVLAFLDHDTYGLGDIVLFGNEERMKVKDHDVLVDIFLDYRVEILNNCIRGWRPSLGSMISLLEDPEGRYNEYVQGHKAQLDDGNEKGKGDPKDLGKNHKKKQKSIFKKSLKETAKENKHKGKKNEENSKTELGPELDYLMTFTEFVVKTFYSLADRLMLCAKSFYTHLPTSCIPLAVAKEMIRLNDQFSSLENGKKNVGCFNELMVKKEEILKILKSLHKQFPGPEIEGTTKDFCLSRASLVFCTASSSIKVGSKVQMVIIDEAAQLKECESAIPLRLPGVRNAILIGDDRQLPAMVQSKVSENANFGRSLFQRLAMLGQKKHLLSIQYRMHPSISLFPNKEFYDKKIVDGPNVKERRYDRHFLKEMKYRSYSFINVARGKEDFDKGHSPRNVEEATVVIQIVAKLFEEHCIKKQKVSVGVISPYKGQVSLIEQKLGKKYAANKETGFSVSVRSVDGFQGGEEDIIIISTVRSNRNGSVGFLSNHQRTNVALTRARYCLWIVGNGITLVKSGSVWKDLVNDAMERGRFCNAGEDDHFDGSFDFDFLKHGKTRWKIFFSDDFKISIASLTGKKTEKKVTEMIKKLGQGWRQPTAEKVVTSELLEQYKVDDGQLYLVWSVDIMKEESKCSQVIQVWDISPASELPKLAKKLIVSFGRYTKDDLDHCKHKTLEGYALNVFLVAVY